MNKASQQSRSISSVMHTETHLDANETMQAGMRLRATMFEIVTAVAEAVTTSCSSAGPGRWDCWQFPHQASGVGHFHQSLFGVMPIPKPCSWGGSYIGMRQLRKSTYTLTIWLESPTHHQGDRLSCIDRTNLQSPS